MLTKKENKEYHKNDTLKYIETINILSPDELPIYSGIRLHPDGYRWFRSGINAKYYDNGQLEWMLEYNEDGSIKNNKNDSYQRDGKLKTFCLR